MNGGYGMINIRELLQKRAAYFVSSHEDSWIKETLYSENIEEWVVVPSGLFYSNRMRSELNALTEKYMIAGIYNLGSPFLDTGVRFELLHLFMGRPDTIDIGIFKARMFDKRPRKHDMGMFSLAEEYSVKYNTYISELEKWINEGITPDHDREGEYEYNTIPLSEYSYSHLAPEYYSRVPRSIWSPMYTLISLMMIVEKMRNSSSRPFMRRRIWIRVCMPMWPERQ